MEKIRALIVDDSTVYRSQIRAALEGVPGVEVVGFASNGRLACELLKSKQVDFISLDLEMPEMDGLATLAELKKMGVTAKVIVFSAQSKSGAEGTLTALRLGASDFIAKPNLDPKLGSPAETIRAHLGPKILSLFAAKPAPALRVAAAVPGLSPAGTPSTAVRYPAFNFASFMPQAVVIASSTGGPAALEKLFAMIRGPVSVPILITQHMPPMFTATLAERLSRISGLNVAEGKHGETLTPGRVYIAPGDYHMRVNSSRIITLDQEPQRNSVRPAADHMFESAVSLFGNRLLGIVLTGMGADGKDGAIALKKAGGPMLIQNRESCVVFGMPGAVFEAGAFDAEESLEKIARRLAQLGVSKFQEAAA